MRTIKDIFDDYRRGDHLGDEELEVLGEQMGAIASRAADFGDVFTLAADYARQVSNNCRDYLHNRRVKRIQEARRLVDETSASISTRSREP